MQPNFFLLFSLLLLLTSACGDDDLFRDDSLGTFECKINGQPYEGASPLVTNGSNLPIQINYFPITNGYTVASKNNNTGENK